MNPHDSHIHFTAPKASDARTTWPQSVATVLRYGHAVPSDRPGPGEELNQGPETTPRPAASVIVLRGGGEALEVLLVKRNPAARFMGAAWVFPGGAVDRHEGEGELALRAAALRELAEEAGIALSSADELVPF